MKAFPQLRVRSEYSFRSCYGPIDDITDRLQEIGCQTAGLVDTSGTWGHVHWEKQMNAAGLSPLFGTEFSMPLEDGRKPKCWALATDLASFYRLSSLNPQTPEEMAGVSGVLRFAGAALSDPDHFDYIDINPRSRRAGMRALSLAKETGKPLVLTSDNDYPSPGDRERFLAWDDSKKMTPQYILTEKELRHALRWMPDDVLQQAIMNTHEAAERASGLKLREAPIISVPGDLRELVEEGRKMRLSRGHISDWTDAYQSRLERELEMIKQKAYESYFIVVADMVRWGKKKMLVGPARGSSAGSLVCYLLEITEIDPLVHGLIFERFIDINRDDLPDIDVDFNDTKRELVFDYLGEKYGAENVARIGSVNRLKPRSVIAHVSKKLGIEKGATFNLLNVLIEHSSGDARYGKTVEDTLNLTDQGQDFLKRWPEATLMGEIENHASHTGVHAAGLIVSNEPVIEYCTVRDGVAHIDKKTAERLNLLKIDVLGLRTLGILEDAGALSIEEFYDLKMDDPAVLKIFNDKKFSGVFQFEGSAQRRVSSQVDIDGFTKIEQVTALARPGPLGGGATDSYIKRDNGREDVTFIHPILEDFLGETKGVILYQEQVMRVVRELGGFSWGETSAVRKAISLSKGREALKEYEDKFVVGAKDKGMSGLDARELWEEICSFGRYGMNKSHTTSYATISYWCAYMKCYHPLQYAAASLRNAKDDEQTLEILREIRDEGVAFIPFDADLSAANWTVADGKLLGGFTNLVGIGPSKAAYYLLKRDGDGSGKEPAGLTDKDREKLARLSPKHVDLSPAHTLWGHMYDNPAGYNINGKIKEFSGLMDKQNECVIVRLVSFDLRDKNEELQVQKRGYRMKGNTKFIDCWMVDDTTSKPVRCRIDSKDWFTTGRKVADKVKAGEDWFLVRGRWLERFSMMSINKIKCLTQEDMFE